MAETSDQQAETSDQQAETSDQQAETSECAELRTTIDSLQKEFETLWMQVSAGGTPSPRYREVRREIDQLRARYAKECGAPSEASDLPRHIVSDWRAG